MALRLSPAASLCWAIGALASVLFALWLLPYVLVLEAFSSGPPDDLGVPALLMLQASLCVAGLLGWWNGRAPLLAAAVLTVIAAHAGLWSIVWPDLSTMLWWPWITPLPLVVPAAIQVVATTRDGV